MKTRSYPEWKVAFPELGQFSKNRLYRILGPVVAGIELIDLPRKDHYRPHFVMYGLWLSESMIHVEDIFSVPIVLLELAGERKEQLSIPYELEGEALSRIINFAKLQIPISFGEVVYFEDLYSVLDIYSRFPPLNAASGSFLQARVAESELRIALFSSEADAYLILREIERGTWDAQHFRLWNTDVKSWLTSLKTLVENRDEFLKSIGRGLNIPKIATLPHSNLAKRF